MNENLQAVGSHIHILNRKAKSGQRKAHWRFLGNVLISGLLYTALVLNILSMFRLEDVSLLAVIPGFFLIAFLNNVFGRSALRFALLTSFLFLLIIFFVIQHKLMIAGLLLIINQIAETIGIHTGFMMKQYAISIDADQYRLAASSFWNYVSVILAFGCHVIVRYRKALLMWIVILPLFVFQIYTGMTPSIYHHVFLFFSALLVANDSFIQRTDRGPLFGNRKNGVVLSVSLIVFVLCSSVFLILNKIEPISGYSKNETIADLQYALTNKMAEFRYEKEKTNTFTQGDFRKLGELKLLDVPALEVIMDQPTSLYLRGYVGSVYTKERWTDLDQRVYYNSHGLFYWLNKSHFHALNQLNTVSDMTTVASKEDQNIHITIHNVNANSKYLYVPYELATRKDQFDKVKTFADSKVMSTAFFGERFYKYQSKVNLVTKYPALASQLYEAKNHVAVDEYLKNESHYNAFVYENYTSIPRETRLLLQNHLGMIKEEQETRRSYEQAIEEVRSYLRKNLTYNMNVEPVQKDKDFLMHFLEDTKEGYATHFATAATVMFRYLGIPSRYVEGYLITPKDVKGASSFEKMTINGTNAHAWPEIYIDEIGWIPIEVTPPYYHMMEKTDLSNYPTGAAAPDHHQSVAPSSSNAPSGKQEVIDREHKKTNKQKPKEKMSLLEKWTIAIIIVIGLLLTGYMLYLMKKRRDVRKRKESFEGANYKELIPKLFAYIMLLLHYDGIPKKGGSTFSYIEALEKKYSKEYIQQFEQVVKINQTSIYSHHEITEEQYIQVKHFMNQTLSDLVKSKNMLQRVKMKFYDFIY